MPGPTAQPAFPAFLAWTRTLELIELALAASAADQTEVTLSETLDATTRFAGDGITQNVLTRDGSLSVRAVVGQRTGRAATSSFLPAEVRRTVERALEAARVASADPEALPLPEATPTGAAVAADPRFDIAALAQPAQARAEAVRSSCAAVRAAGLRPAGTYNTSGEQLIVANSRGLIAAHQGSSAAFAVTALGADGSGWAERVAHGPAGVDVAAATAAAIAKGQASSAPSDLAPGDYPVVLEPPAVADLLNFLGPMSFSGLAWHEGRSFLSGKLGETLFSPLVTLVDDALDPRSQGPRFDGEGLPRQRVVLIDRGRAVAVVHDRRSARAAGTSSTGHSLEQPNTWGPAAQNLVMAPGSSSLAELIAGTARGVLVSRLHYTNVLDPTAMVLTGMTRDGTFLIEDGKVTRALTNLRFSQSVPELLLGVEAVGRDAVLHRSLFGGSLVVPALRASRFHFSSGTGF